MIPRFAQYVSILSREPKQYHGNHKKWEDWEKKYLKEYYPIRGMKHCAKYLHRTPETVQQMARRLKCCIRGYFAKNAE